MHIETKMEFPNSTPFWELNVHYTVDSDSYTDRYRYEDKEELDKKITSYKKLFENNSLLLYYEDLVQNWDKELSKVYEFIKENNFQVKMTTYKRSPVLCKLLANYDEHRRFFKQTIYSDFFES